MRQQHAWCVNLFHPTPQPLHAPAAAAGRRTAGGAAVLGPMRGRPAASLPGGWGPGRVTQPRCWGSCTQTRGQGAMSGRAGQRSAAMNIQLGSQLHAGLTGQAAPGRTAQAASGRWPGSPSHAPTCPSHPAAPCAGSAGRRTPCGKAAGQAGVRAAPLLLLCLLACREIIIY